MQPGTAKTAAAKGWVEAALRGKLTETQTRRLAHENPEVLVLALLAASQRIAELQGHSQEPHPSLSTPSGMVPIYTKPNTTKRRKKPGAKIGHSGQLNMPDGRIMHCEFRVGRVRFFLSEELREHGGTASPKSVGGTTVAIHLYVDDCDAMVAQMKSCGARVIAEPADMFWGERFARVRDPFGHERGITTHLRDMTPAEIQAAATELFEDLAG